jgi:DNA-binding transcriptional LysR family regulator
MHIGRTDLNLFLVFDAIYTEGSITRAAEVLNLTQPAVSHALARLREMLNDELFVRTRARDGRSMVPTPAAHALVGPVRESLRGLTDAVQGAHGFDPAASTRTFRVSLGDIFEALVLPPLVARIAVEAPGVELVNVRVARGEIAGELAAGRLDLTVDVLSRIDERLRVARIASDDHVCLLAADHPLARADWSLDDYLAQGHILASSRATGPGFIDVELARRGHRRRIVLRCQHYFAAALVAARTQLVLTVPRALAGTLQVLPGLVARPFPATLNPLEAWVYWHASRERDPASRWLRGMMLPSSPDT